MNPSTYGQAVTLTAVVTPAGATGKVTFLDGVQLLETAPVANGQATLTTVLPNTGNRALRAVFTGSATYSGSVSAPLPQTVNPVAANDFKPAAITASGSPVAVSDLNGDGKADLVTTTGVALGNGDGTFQPFRPTSAAPVAVGDFNGDGKPDLATGSGILLGNGDGTFQTLIAYPSGRGVVGAVADFNGDGKADLATNTGVLLGNGDGTFQSEIGYPAGSLNSPNSGNYKPLGQGNVGAAIGDFNGDGKADVLVVYVWTEPGMSVPGYTGVVLLGNGDGTFQPPIQTSVAGSPLAGISIVNSIISSSSIVFLPADFNGDGKDDVAESINGVVNIFLNTGDGTLRFNNGYSVASRTAVTELPVAASDFNGDGKLDLAVAGPDNGAVEVLLGNGDGTFQPGVLWAVSNADGFPAVVVTGDFNGDGRADVAAGSMGQSGSLGLLLGSNVAGPPSIPTLSLPKATLGVAYSVSLSANGGIPPYSHWIVLGGSLPAGLTLDAASGILSGTPTVQQLQQFYVSVEDSTANLAPEQPLVLGFNPRLVVTPEVLPGGFLGVFYSHQLVATNGAGSSQTWAVVSGSLPPGLTLNATSGVISGIPTTTTGSPFGFSVTATDASGVSLPQAFSIPIAATGSTPTVASLNPPSVPVGSPAIAVTVSGNAFFPGSVVLLDGLGVSRAPLMTTYVDPGTLLAQIPAANLGNAGFANILVQNPDGTVSKSVVAFGVVSLGPPLQFVPVTPCRVMDTRNAAGPLGGPFIAANTSRAIPVPSSACGIPANAAAYSLNVTAVPRTGALGFLSLGVSPSLVQTSTLNSPNGLVLANAAIVAAGTGGAVYAFASNDTDLVVDINGYFVPPAAHTLQFFPLPPCRVLDTRNSAGTFGGPSIAGNTSRSFPIPESPCGVPANAAAYSLNVTAVPQGPLSYLTVWPTGQTQPFVSTLNSFDGTTLANAAIVPAGSGGSVSFYATDPTDVVVDINGYFAPPGPGGLSFYSTVPCRMVDTRSPFEGVNGAPAMDAGTARTFRLPEAFCPNHLAAPAYSLNVTAVPHGVLGYLSIWPTGATQPPVSTLNAWKGQIVANAALVAEGTGGSVDVFVSDPTDVVIDLNGYFAP